MTNTHTQTHQQSVTALRSQHNEAAINCNLSYEHQLCVRVCVCVCVCVLMACRLVFAASFQTNSHIRQTLTLMERCS